MFEEQQSYPAMLFQTDQEKPLLYEQEANDIHGDVSNTDSFDVSKGEKQPNAFRDWPFALLFYCHLIAMIAVGLSLGAPALARKTDENEDDNDEDDYANDYEGFLKVALCSACFGFIAAFCSLGAMMACPKQIIQFSLMFTIICSFILAIAAFAAGSLIGGLIGILLFLLSACYAYCVWSRIPFAAANLNTGIKAVKTNCGLTVVAYLMTMLGMVYTLIWILAVIGVYDKTSDCDGDDCEEEPNYGVMFILFVFYFWMQQVTQNVVHVTVAGTVGTWWFYPAEAASCCSKAITDSFCRATTYSFGSICFGSLLVAIVQACRQLIEMAKQNDDGNALLLCLLDCFLSIIEGLLRYFNKWAYVYVGVYGYSYIEAAKGVTDLFQSRGWTTIVADDLVSNALSLVILVDALIVGLLGLALTQIDSWFPDNSDVELMGFLISFIIGIVIAGIMLGVVDSSVNSVIVLFAEAPNEFSANHPELYNEMISAWREAYPLTCGFE